jgi:hypothetical protein
MMCAALDESPMQTEKKWENLTPLEKREERYQAWINADIDFSSPEAV